LSISFHQNFGMFSSSFFVLFQVDGYARLFGIFKEVRMLVTSDSLQMYLTTEVNKSFKINVHVTTNYSSDRNETQFNATVVFDNGLSKVRSHSFIKLHFQSFLSKAVLGFRFASTPSRESSNLNSHLPK